MAIFQSYHTHNNQHSLFTSQQVQLPNQTPLLVHPQGHDPFVAHNQSNIINTQRFYHDPQAYQEQVQARDELLSANRIMTHFNCALGLIMETTKDDTQARQQQVISLLYDVLQQQPDPPLIDMIIDSLRRHGINAVHHVRGTALRPDQKVLFDHHNYPRNEHCLVRLGPVVLELTNDGGYTDLLRGARDLCQLKHTHVSGAGANHAG